MKYFLVKQTEFIIVRAETESQALDDCHCPLHSMHSHGQAYVYFEKSVEAESIWRAKDIFDEELRMERSR